MLASFSPPVILSVVALKAFIFTHKNLLHFYTPTYYNQFVNLCQGIKCKKKRLFRRIYHVFSGIPPQNMKSEWIIDNMEAHYSFQFFYFRSQKAVAAVPFLLSSAILTPAFHAGPEYCFYDVCGTKDKKQRNCICILEAGSTVLCFSCTRGGVARSEDKNHLRYAQIPVSSKVSPMPNFPDGGPPSVLLFL